MQARAPSSTGGFQVRYRYDQTITACWGFLCNTRRFWLARRFIVTHRIPEVRTYRRKCILSYSYLTNFPNLSLFSIHISYLFTDLAAFFLTPTCTVSLFTSPSSNKRFFWYIASFQAISPISPICLVSASFLPKFSFLLEPSPPLMILSPKLSTPQSSSFLKQPNPADADRPYLTRFSYCLFLSTTPPRCIPICAMIWWLATDAEASAILLA